MSTKNPGCLPTILGVKPKESPQNSTRSTYFLSNQFFSPAEANFYHILSQMVGKHLLVFPKISLKEFISVSDQSDKSQRQSYFNKIDRKHVDFLVCNPDTLQPLFAIELDDSSHRKAGQGERDAFKESVLATSNLPLVRVPVRATYDTQELGVLFKNALKRREIRVASQDASKQVEATSGIPPACPNCGSEMVLRTAKRGASVGEKFWGCPNFPECRTIMKIA
jgi:hypothetical protein